MTTSFDSAVRLSEQELLDHFERLVARDRRTTAALLVAIAEIDERKLWARHACSSMFSFCMERFHMSEQVTAKRLWAARTARRFPVVLDLVARGQLHLTAIHLLSRHLTTENHLGVLERARHKSSREVERLVAELAPRADVASRIRAMPGPRGAGAANDGAAALAVATLASAAPALADGGSSNYEQAGGASDRCTSTDCESAGCSSDRPAFAASEVVSVAIAPRSAQPATVTKPIVPLSPRRYKIEITVDEATHDKLRSLQDLLGRSETGRDAAAIISRAIDVLLVRTLARKAGCTDRPKPRTSTNAECADRPGSMAPASNTAASRRGQRSAAPQRGHRSRAIPAAVRREVWRRDSGRCCYEDARGRRCRETSNVELHHKTPFAVGGQPTLQNIELRCAAHNQYQADLDFGRSFMDARRSNFAGARTFPAECRGTAAAA
jgi:5-methylcytosine-specific restriction endonuclease McrA